MSHLRVLDSESYTQTKTTQFFFDLNKFVYYLGLPSFWIEGVKLSNNVTNFYNLFNKIGNFCVLVLVLLQYGAFFTQKNMTEKQSSDHFIFCLAQGLIAYFHWRITNHNNTIRDVTYTLGIALKRVHNNLEVEKKMIKKSKVYSVVLMMNCVSSVIIYSYQACMQVIQSGATFSTVITVWPDVQDNSFLANIMRITVNIFWWIFVTRVLSVYALVICLASCMSHQYANLQSYFLSLNDIFKEDSSKDTKEELYEEGVKVGIQLHSKTLRCTKQIQVICHEVASGQIILNLLLLVVFMYQMMALERTLTNVFTVVITALTVLLSTGFFMWNAGDITVEAAILSTAMYSSGWQNCSGPSSVRVRNLLTIAMNRAQQPVILKGLGIIELSYSAYVSIVKSSYSIFSVIF